MAKNGARPIDSSQFTPRAALPVNDTVSNGECAADIRATWRDNPRDIGHVAPVANRPWRLVNARGITPI